MKVSKNIKFYSTDVSNYEHKLIVPSTAIKVYNNVLK